MRGQGIRMILKSLRVLTSDIWRQRKGGRQEGMKNEERGGEERMLGSDLGTNHFVKYCSDYRKV